MRAAEATLNPAAVRFDANIEPLVRLLEETPRARLLEEIGARIRRGLAYRELLAALLLAGVRNIQPRPVGFKFHAVLVVNSAHLAALSSPDADRWLPIFWALDYFKDSQARDERQGDWKMGPADETAVPDSLVARGEFVRAMDNWDEQAADAAVAGLVRAAGAQELFELFCRYGARDFRDIGHKAIYVANSWRTLQCIGWQHSEPVLRSLAYALLAHEGGNPARGDAPADRPWRRNLELAQRIRKGWRGGTDDSAATGAILDVQRHGSPEEVCDQIVRTLNDGISPRSVWDGLFGAAAEILMCRPNIVSLHAVTSTNALHYAFLQTADDETRRMLMLQNAAFLALFRGEPARADQPRIDELGSAENPGASEDRLGRIFAQVSRDNRQAAGLTLDYLKSGGDARAFIDVARRFVFLKGTNSHDYKFSSAVLEDYFHIGPAWRDRCLAASVYKLRGSDEPENTLVPRSRAALAG